MIEKLKLLFAKHKDIITYVFFGVLTTIVSYGVYFPLYNLLQLSASVCNVISWVAAVMFAFYTNKPFVFHSYDWSFKVVSSEFIKFVGSRFGSFLIETAAIFVLVDLLRYNGNIMKLIVSIIVVILNYLTSKLFVFSKKRR